mgnify:CR=1 FL=1
MPWTKGLWCDLVWSFLSLRRWWSNGSSPIDDVFHNIARKGYFIRRRHFLTLIPTLRSRECTNIFCEGAKFGSLQWLVTVMCQDKRQSPPQCVISRIFFFFRYYNSPVRVFDLFSQPKIISRELMGRFSRNLLWSFYFIPWWSRPILSFNYTKMQLVILMPFSIFSLKN